MLELVIFDLDGLLVNSEEIYGKGWKIGLEKVGASIDNETLENMIGNGTSTNTKIILDIVKSMEKVNEVRKIREKFYFDCVENIKPKPDIYLKTLEKMNVKSNNAIALEDSITGVKSAIAAKIKVALVNTKKMDFDIDSEYFLGKFNDLEEVYKKILKDKLN